MIDDQLKIFIIANLDEEVHLMVVQYLIKRHYQRHIFLCKNFNRPSECMKFLSLNFTSIALLTVHPTVHIHLIIKGTIQCNETIFSYSNKNLWSIFLDANDEIHAEEWKLMFLLQPITHGASLLVWFCWMKSLHTPLTEFVNLNGKRLLFLLLF